MKILAISAAILVSMTAIAAAQTATPGIDARQANQQNRINKGVSSGQLTNREAANLQRGQARIQRMETRSASDGVVTGREKARINRAQNVESRKIFNKKHNQRTQ